MRTVWSGSGHGPPHPAMLGAGGASATAERSRPCWGRQACPNPPDPGANGDAGESPAAAEPGAGGAFRGGASGDRPLISAAGSTGRSRRPASGGTPRREPRVPSGPTLLQGRRGAVPLALPWLRQHSFGKGGHVGGNGKFPPTKPIAFAGWGRTEGETRQRFPPRERAGRRTEFAPPPKPKGARIPTK